MSDPVDLRTFHDTLRDAGIDDVAGMLLDTFLEDCVQRIAEVRAARAERELERLRRAAHAYKSAAAQIHATTLADRLGAVERAARDADLDAAVAAALEAEAEHERVVAFLQQRPGG